MDCTTKTSTSPNHREKTLIRKTGWGTTEGEGEREREREREGGGVIEIYIYMDKGEKEGEDSVLYENGG